MTKYLNWQSMKAYNAVIPSALHDWLVYSGSFMTRLKTYGMVNPRVEVLNQSWQYPENDEQTLLHLEPDQTALVREVFICDDTYHFMWARTVFPRETLTGKYECLANLENRSLGSVLFQDPELKRSEFEFACLHPENNIWARRSLFFLREKSLLLMEVFLPDMKMFSPGGEGGQ